MSNIPYLYQLDRNASVTANDLTAMAMAVAKASIPVPAPVAPYKVFTALLYQSGGDDPNSQYEGVLVIGKTYTILDMSDGSFIEVGAPNNNVGTSFIATGTNPNWGTDSGTGVSYNNGAPVATVLENTIGNIWFEYDSVGSYTFNSIGLFTLNKSIAVFMPNQYVETPTDLYNFQIFQADINIFGLNSFYNYNTSDSMIGSFAQTSIEIRVYN